MPAVGASPASVDSGLLWSALFEALPEGIALLDSVGMVRQWNRASAVIYGFQEAEILGRPWTTFVPSDRQASMRRLHRRAWIGERTESIDSSHVRKDGAAIDVKLSLEPVRSESGVVVAVLMIVRDATATTRLLARASELRVLFDVLPATVFYVDTDGQIRFINQTAHHHFGIDHTTAPGRDFREVFGTDLHGKCRAHVARALSGTEVEFELRPRGAREAELVVQVNLRPDYDAFGKVCGVIGVVTDISSIKRYEAELQRTNAALVEAKLLSDAATAAKTEFLANMSHEIRTPMTAILGYADVLVDAGTTLEERRDAAETIRRNGNHMVSVINDILDVSKIEAGQLTIESVPCSPSEILSDVVDLLRLRAEAKKLSLTLDYRTPIPSRMVADPTRLRQILLNLVGNAIKFTHAGGVAIDVSFDGGDAKRPTIVIQIRDSGIGMDAAALGRLFEPFSQGDTSTTRRYGGTGLGLSISRRLARLMGGDIEVTSEVNVGSTFRVRLPTGPIDAALLGRPSAGAGPASAPIAGGATAPAELAGCRVLYAEDGPDNQRLITRFLEKSGAMVRLVENGREALEEVMRAASGGGAYDIVLMDMLMPEMDGYEATRQLRERGYRGPIVALSASAMSQDRQRCMESGCDWFASKPIRRDELIAALTCFYQRRT